MSSDVHYVHGFLFKHILYANNKTHTTSIVLPFWTAFTTNKKLFVHTACRKKRYGKSIASFKIARFCGKIEHSHLKFTLENNVHFILHEAIGLDRKLSA